MTSIVKRHSAAEHPPLFSGTNNLRADRGGFTLLELLVTLGVIALISIFLFPALSSARRQAQSAGCISNLRQIYMAAQLYSADHESIIVPSSIDDEFGNTHHWVRLITPYFSSKKTKSDRDLTCPGKIKSVNKWHWGYAINETPGYEGDETTHDQKQLTRHIHFKTYAITHAPRRLFMCDGAAWHINPTFIEAASLQFHGKALSNSMFFDGHAESLTHAQIQKAVYNPGS